jgi:hypothetical protein
VQIRIAATPIKVVCMISRMLHKWKAFASEPSYPGVDFGSPLGKANLRTND